MTDAVTRFEMPKADPTSARIVINSMSSDVLSKMAPSESATWRTGDATESVITSWI